ncbi:MAG: hypothetical protein J7527_01230, partial [Chitinophagaceae bacterium]|nr:hypothetical protein [Chitinophagaceae bacterium]
MKFFNRKVIVQTTATTMVSNGMEIFEDIKKHILQAQQSVKVAAVWFTDSDLFQLLMDKQRSSPG